MKTLMMAFLTMALMILHAVALPDEPRVFENWKDCFRFMAGDGETLDEADDDTLFKLAAESSMSWFWLQEGSRQTVIVIRLDYLQGPYSAIRGVQGNGLFYLFIPLEKGFQFVGRMEGNSFKWGTRNGRARFTTSSHMSARQAYEAIYDWNGSTFAQTSRILYHCEPDGSRFEVNTKREEAKSLIPEK